MAVRFKFKFKFKKSSMQGIKIYGFPLFSAREKYMKTLIFVNSNAFFNTQDEKSSLII